MSLVTVPPVHRISAPPLAAMPLVTVSSGPDHQPVVRDEELHWQGPLHDRHACQF